MPFFLLLAAALPQFVDVTARSGISFKVTVQVGTTLARGKQAVGVGDDC